MRIDAAQKMAIGCLLIGMSVIGTIKGVDGPKFLSSFQQNFPSPTPDPVPTSVFSKGVDEYAVLHGLTSLARESLHKSEYEIRAWIGFSIFFPRGLVLSNRGGVRTATYITGKVDASDKPVIVKNLTPQSSKDLEHLGPDFGIEQLIVGNYPADRGWGADPDGVSVVVELRRGEIYRLISYSVITKSTNGKQILKYFRDLEKIYNIRLISAETP